MKNVLLIGFDGYIGWALLQRLVEGNYHITCIDNLIRRDLVHDMHSNSALPIQPVYSRINWMTSMYSNVEFHIEDYLLDDHALDWIFNSKKFDTVINLAHQPSGPYSQKSYEAANFTLQNNILGTNKLLWLIKKHCPEAHYITIGSTGELDHTLDIPIEEGYFTLENASAKSIFPRRTNSIYHVSKIANTYLIDSLARMWNIKCTDIMQAVVFGSYTDEIDKSKNFTRLDCDTAFGTVCNRFMVQAVLGKDLTVYGMGEHNRGFIALNDSIQALMIAIENDSEEDFSSDYSPRVWNQLSFWTSINELAYAVRRIALKEFNINVNIVHVNNPRHEKTEAPRHYSYKTDILNSYGYIPSRSLEEELVYTMKLLFENRFSLGNLKHTLNSQIRFK